MAARLIPVLTAIAALATGPGESEGGAKSGGAARQRCVLDDVLATPDEQYVVLLRTVDGPLVFVPIAVAEMDAVALRLRLDGVPPPRPLTLNLLESVLARSKINVVEVSIEEQDSGSFRGRIRLVQGGRTWDMDSRPSDAIGLAVGKGIPIYVTREVLDGAGIDVAELESEDESLEDSL